MLPVIIVESGRVSRVAVAPISGCPCESMIRPFTVAAIIVATAKIDMDRAVKNRLAIFDNLSPALPDFSLWGYSFISN